MWNPFAKKSTQPVAGTGGASQPSDDPQNMGFMQRLAMKKLASMSEAERMKLMQKVLTPDNIQKNKGQILGAMEQMKASGQISEAQMREAKQRMGL
ncbi:hypothetical protein EPO05_02475 [Patescibacteria group bacterium]|nr:MAG: hypothetical protein EPO05_02475 [Patescibacteria group bacterium]